ncbi:hypothetical protein B0A55_09954 [Friedmanniomyces simplex]|uniref:Kinesin light chain n=1 Tax=Friedmanniomyces simplex TaxID=329884 RepID=A0A4U0X857_9PEZI|nr:hypothetical protein B0A55_09954 [Friedmanniomyces simplex]
MEERCWQMTKNKLGEDHPDTLVSVGELAGYYNRLGDSRRAVVMEEERWKIRDKFKESRISLPLLSSTNAFRMRGEEKGRAQHNPSSPIKSQGAPKLGHDLQKNQATTVTISVVRVKAIAALLLRYARPQPDDVKQMKVEAAILNRSQWK